MARIPAGTVRRAMRRKLPRELREQQMLDVAARVFAERGFHHASMDEIARACGLTKPMLYAYFKSKEGLYLATVDRAGRYLVGSVGKLLEQRDPLARLRKGAEILLGFIDRDRHGWAVLFAEGLREGPVARHVAMYRAQIARAAAYTLAQARGGEEPTRSQIREAEPWAIGLLGSGEAVARWWLAQPSIDVRRVTRIVTVMIEGIHAAYLTAGRKAARG